MIAFFLLLTLFSATFCAHLIQDTSTNQVYYVNGDSRRRIPSMKVFKSHDYKWDYVKQVSHDVVMQMKVVEDLYDVDPAVQNSLVSHPTLIPNKDPGQLEFNHKFAFGSDGSLSFWVWLWEMPLSGSGDFSIAHINPSPLNGELAPAIVLSHMAQNISHPYFCIYHGGKSMGVISRIPIAIHNWTHLAVSLNTTHMNGYVNGMLAATFSLPYEGIAYNEFMHPASPQVLYIGRSPVFPSAVKGFVSQVYYFENYAVDEEDLEILASRELGPVDFPKQYIHFAGLNNTFLFETAVNRSMNKNPWAEIEVATGEVYDREQRNLSEEMKMIEKEKKMEGKNEKELMDGNLNVEDKEAQNNNKINDVNEIRDESVITKEKEEEEENELIHILDETEFCRYLYLLSVLPLSAEQEERLRLEGVNETSIEQLKIQNYGGFLALGHSHFFGEANLEWIPAKGEYNYTKLLLEEEEEDEEEDLFGEEEIWIKVKDADKKRDSLLLKKLVDKIKARYTGNEVVQADGVGQNGVAVGVGGALENIVFNEEVKVFYFKDGDMETIRNDLSVFRDVISEVSKELVDENEKEVKEEEKKEEEEKNGTMSYKMVHDDWTRYLPSNCPVALSYYSLTAHKAFQLFDDVGSSTSLVEDTRLYEENTDLKSSMEGEGNEVLQFQMQQADAGDHNAQMFVGQQLYWGRGGVERDQHRAIEYFDRAAQGGQPLAQYNLGVMNLHGGGGLEVNRNEAMRLFRLAADQGYAPAQNGLGVQYMDGVDKNLTTAFHFFKKAADGGSTDGMINVANLYKTGSEMLGGEGPKKNLRAALYYFGKAALAQHSSALYMLGVSYKDRSSWISKMDTDDVVTVYSSDRSEKLVLPMRYDCHSAVSFLKQVSELTLYADILKKGVKAFITEKNSEKSLYYFSLTAELGFVSAIANAQWLHSQATAEHALANSLKRSIQGSMQNDLYSLVSGGDLHYYGLGRNDNKTDAKAAVLFYFQGLTMRDVRSIFSLSYMSFKEEGGLFRNQTYALLNKGISIASHNDIGELVALYLLKVTVMASDMRDNLKLSEQDIENLGIFFLVVLLICIHKVILPYENMRMQREVNVIVEQMNIRQEIEAEERQRGDQQLRDGEQGGIRDGGEDGEEKEEGGRDGMDVEGVERKEGDVSKEEGEVEMISEGEGDGYQDTERMIGTNNKDKISIS